MKRFLLGFVMMSSILSRLHRNISHPELVQNTDVLNLSSVPSQSPAKMQPSPTLSLSETEEESGLKSPNSKASKVKHYTALKLVRIAQV